MQTFSVLNTSKFFKHTRKSHQPDTEFQLLDQKSFFCLWLS